jgi:hypothetical protein
LFATGFRFHPTSQRRHVPRTQKDLDALLKAKAEPAAWLAEREVRIQRGAGGLLVCCGQQELSDRQQVLAWHDGEWLQGRVRLLGDGRKALLNPVVALTRTRRSVTLAPGMRLRLRSKNEE